MNSIKSFYSNAYNGKETPLKVFLIGYLLMIVFFALLLGFLQSVHNAIYYLCVLRLLYSYWLVVSFWRCSKNSRNSFFNFLSKLMAAFVVLDCIVTANILLR